MLCALVTALTLVVAPTSWSAESEAPHVADFELTVRSTDSGLELYCHRGCAWELLSFGAELHISPQVVDHCGMNDESDADCGELARLDPFKFTVQLTELGVRFEGQKGTAWEHLSFSCPLNRCKQVVNAMGMMHKERQSAQ